MGATLVGAGAPPSPLFVRLARCSGSIRPECRPSDLVELSKERLEVRAAARMRGVDMPVGFIALVSESWQNGQSEWSTYLHVRLEWISTQSQRGVLPAPSRCVYYALPAIKCDRHRAAVKEIFAVVPETRLQDRRFD